MAGTGSRIAPFPAGGGPGGGRRARALLAGLALGLLFGPVHALDVVDDRGAQVRFAQPPQRIVSLVPSITEVVCALDACGRLVGVDDWSNWPAAVRGLPRVGGLEDARVETIVGLKPDLVLTATSSRALDRLQALGVTVLALEPRSLADVQRVLGVLGPLLGARDGADTWREIERGVAQAAAELPPALRGTRVYFEVGNGPYAASEASFIGELLARAGAANVVPASLGPFPKLNPEFVVRADPQVVFVSARDAAQLATRPGWQRIAAVRDGRVCAFSPAQADVLMRPGPRMAEAVRLMVRCIRGGGAGGGK